jgi:hypothetical protein
VIEGVAASDTGRDCVRWSYCEKAAGYAARQTLREYRTRNEFGEAFETGRIPPLSTKS